MVAGALVQDVLFSRVGPAHYALSSVIKHHLSLSLPLSQPEATVAGALARDVLFSRVSPAHYAFSSVIKHHLSLSLPLSQPEAIRWQARSHGMCCSRA